MFSTLDEIRKLKHPNYQIMELQGDELNVVLSSWSRHDLIEWLVWNDRNGVYRDEDSLREFNNILGKEEAISIITRQISWGFYGQE